jgi:hypothetical protein
VVEGYLTEHFSLTPYFVLFSGYEKRDLGGRDGIWASIRILHFRYLNKCTCTINLVFFGFSFIVSNITTLFEIPVSAFIEALSLIFFF